MVELEEVKRNHNCAECGKRLYGQNKINPSMRVSFEGTNYCTTCGYFKVQERIDELNIVNRNLADKYTKEIIVRRLTKE